MNEVIRSVTAALFCAMTATLHADAPPSTQPSMNTTLPAKSAAAKAQDTLVSKIMSRIPKQMLPAADDTELDLTTKSDAVREWLQKNKLVDPAGTKMTLTMPFDGAELVNGLHGDKPYKALYIRFKQRSSFKDLPCDLFFYGFGKTTGPDDPEIKKAKQLEKQGAGTMYLITGQVTGITISFRKNPEGANLVHVCLWTAPGLYTLKQQPNQP